MLRFGAMADVAELVAGSIRSRTHLGLLTRPLPPTVKM